MIELPLIVLVVQPRQLPRQLINLAYRIRLASATLERDSAGDGGADAGRAQQEELPVDLDVTVAAPRPAKGSPLIRKWSRGSLSMVSRPP